MKQRIVKAFIYIRACYRIYKSNKRPKTLQTKLFFATQTAYVGLLGLQGK